MADDEKPKAPRKRASKRAPRGVGDRAQIKDKPTAADKRKAAAAIASVTPINRGPDSPSRGRRGMRGNPTSPEGLRIAERRTRALQLRRMGLTFQQVADTLHSQYPDGTPASYDKGDAAKDIKAMLDAVTVESVQSYLEEDLALLLAMQRRYFPAALNGDVGAGRVMLGILDRRSKYLGLDAPVKHQLTGADGGPIHLAVEEPGDVYRAALDGLDSLLPHVEVPGLTGTTGPEKE